MFTTASVGEQLQEGATDQLCREESSEQKEGKTKVGCSVSILADLRRILCCFVFLSTSLRFLSQLPCDLWLSAKCRLFPTESASKNYTNNTVIFSTYIHPFNEKIISYSAENFQGVSESDLLRPKYLSVSFICVGSFPL